MLRHKGIKKHSIIALVAIFTFFPVAGHFQNNIIDPSPLYMTKGLNKYPTINVDKKNGREVDTFNISISPYYMTANNGYDKNSGGVKNGDIYGYWNFFGFFLGKQGIDNSAGDDVFRGNNPAGKLTPTSTQSGEVTTFSANPGWNVFNNYPNLQKVYNKLVSIQNGTEAPTLPVPSSGLLQDYITDWAYNDPSANNTVAGGIFTEKYGQFSVEAAMRRMGVRTELEFRLFDNLRASLRTGFTDYRIKPIFNYLGSNNTAIDTTALGYLNGFVLAPSQYKSFFQDIDLSIDAYSASVMEDIHVQLSYDYAVPFKGPKGNVVLNVVPYLSVGAWLPAGPQKDISKAFQIPVGNNGLFAGTADFGVLLDFADMITFGFGGGITLTQNQDFRKERVPTSIYQSGFFPWTTQVKRTIGTTWYLNASIQCLNFTDGFSFYGDITLAEHSADKIAFNENNALKAELLESINAAGILSGMSAWRSQNYNLGIDLELTPNLTAGWGMQGSLGGVRVWKNITLIGSLRFEF